MRADPRRHHGERPHDQGAWRSRPSRRSCTCSIATTGKPVWPIEERPVAERRRAGRVVFADAAVPDQAAGLRSPGRVAIDDLIDFTPELHAEAVKLVAKYKIGPLFTPPVVSKADGPLGTLALPRLAGRQRTGRAARTIPKRTCCTCFRRARLRMLGLVPPPRPRFRTWNYMQGTDGLRTAHGTGRLEQAPAPRPEVGRGGRRGRRAALTVQGLPLLKPPYGRITAIDLEQGRDRVADRARRNAGQHQEQSGAEGPEHSAHRPARHHRNAGDEDAGDRRRSRLLHHAVGQRGAMLRAYDKATGKEVGAVYMPAPQSGSPMTYMLNGQQYIVVAIGGAGYSGELVAFKLPGDAPLGATAAR